MNHKQGQLALLAMLALTGEGLYDVRITGAVNNNRLVPTGPVGKQVAGRNDPCPCGSGKKFKRCCLRGKEEVQP